MVQNSLDIIRGKAIPLKSEKNVVDEILSLVGEARFVLLGEASHGTQEFYSCRAEITKRLISEKEFSAVAVEADFPDTYRVNRFVHHLGKDKTATEALSDFQQFPLWMWRNEVVLKFIEWLKKLNQNKLLPKQTGFYGIDLYSLHSSIRAVLNYLEKVDPQAAERAKYRYSCFDHHGEDAQAYGYAASFDLSQSCEQDVITQLVELQKRAADYANRDGFVARDEYFFAEQNARLIKNAEEYYRQMFHERISSWNLRDSHMAETLTALSAHLESQEQSGKIIVWAHNSHLGDARGTDMTQKGEWNVGQLIREKFPQDTVSIGFTTYKGTVTAATNWDEPAQFKKVRPGLGNSYENLFHQVGIEKFFLNLRGVEIREILRQPLLERAIGVIYRPETERLSHYFKAHLSEQFDGIIHFDETSALQPLDRIASANREDVPETFPEGL